jgi:putative PIN family toxin of toxin-antitoxin system
MRIVLDANVLVSALISRTGAPARILDRWERDEFEIAISPAILDELDRVLHYPRLQERFRLPERSIERFLGLLARQAVEAVATEELEIIESDPTDNRYLECALAAGAEIIVSGDRHLLELGEYQGLQILSPAGFLTLLNLEHAERGDAAQSGRTTSESPDQTREHQDQV